MKNVSQNFTNALIAYEDKRFYYHHGVDFLALSRAVLQWCRYGHVVSGGSTLTMQTAKLLDPGSRTIFRKLLEMFRALQLERHYTKSQILQMYLTLAPYGGNLEGIQAASLFYFGKTPRHLTTVESALLLAILQSPAAFHPHRNPKRALLQRNEVLKRLHFSGNEEPLGVIPPRPFTRDAYHVGQFFRKQNRRGIVVTTLDKTIQNRVLHLLQAALPPSPSPKTGAALVIDNRTCQVIAYVGSAFPYDPLRQGYVDIITAVRSPGSALKPFIYALAFDEGILTPESTVMDKPSTFGTYVPKNFSDIFHGNVSVSYALQNSLNIPAVYALEKVSPGRFLYHFDTYGIRFHLPPTQDKPSLAIALGGVGISLWDLTSLYCALANKGLYQPLRLEKGKVQPSQPLFTPQSARWITQILRSAPPPGGHTLFSPGMAPTVAFKTGTSYGYRDAVCFGYSDRYTVGVWLGRADGTATSDQQIGRIAAAPLLFQIFELIDPQALRLSFSAKEEFSSFAVDPLLSQREPLQITFPQDQGVVMMESGVPVSITMKGGKPPYTWYINGEPTWTETQNTKNLWVPAGEGFYTLTLVDSEGQRASSNVRMCN